MMFLVSFTASVAGGYFAETRSSYALFELPPSQTLSPFAEQLSKRAEDELKVLLAREVSASTISKQTLNSAQDVLSALPVGIPFPHLSSSSDGEIGFSWSRGRDRFEAVIGEEVRLVWISMISGKFSRGGDLPAETRYLWQIFFASLKGFYGRL